MLMEDWRGNLETSELEKAWADAESAAEKQSTRLNDLLWPCCICRQDLPHSAYGFHGDAIGRASASLPVTLITQLQKQLRSHGEWRQCRECATSLKAARQTRTVIECTICKEEKPGDQFDAQKLAAWTKQRNLTHTAVCLQCTQAKTIKCTMCREDKSEEAFDAGNLLVWRRSGHLARTAICLECAPKQKSNFGKVDAKLQVTCSGCSQSLVLNEFDTLTMLPKIKVGDLTFLQCIDCMSDALFTSRRPWLRKRTYLCHGNGCAGKCSHPRSEFSRHMQMSHNLSAWKCEACRRPTCTKCNSRQEKPVMYSWAPPFVCLGCVYPACSGCGRQRLSKERKAKHQFRTWRCSVCLQLTKTAESRT